MTRNERLALFIFAGLSFSNAVSSVFVNMYLYRFLSGIAELTVFNLFQFGVMPAGFYAAGRAANRIGKKGTLVAGLCGFVLFYGLLIFLGERAADLLYLLGTINGLANGFFWFSFNFLLTRITEESTRGRFFGVFGAIGSVAGASAPIISTVLLGLSPSLETGYLRIFMLIIAVSAAMGIAALGLAVVEGRERFTVTDKLLPGKDREWRFAILANLTYGIRDGANWSILSVLILKAAGSDVRAGSLSILFALVGATANAVGGRFLTSRRSLSYWFWGSIAALASSVLLVALPNPVAAAVSGSVWKASEALVLLPFNVAVYTILAFYEKRDGGMSGRNIAMETVLNFGRSLGVLSFLLLSYLTPWYAEILFPVVTLSLPLSFFIYRRYAVVSR